MKESDNIGASSQMESFMLMHKMSMHENYDLKWSQTWPLFFVFFIKRETGGPGGICLCNNFLNIYIIL